MELAMVIYDIEIAKAMPPRDGILQAGINYCKGWQDYNNVGISVIGAYDYAEDRYRVFCGDNLESFAALLNNCEILVGFNNRSFDDRVLLANGIPIPPQVKSYDLLQECWRANGIDTRLPFHPATHGGFSLEKLAQINLGRGKTGQGEDMPLQWQQGNYGKVIDYCLTDVWLTKRLLDLVRVEGRLRHPRNPAQWLEICKP